LCKFCENRARDAPLRGVYIPHFGQIPVRISVFGVLYPYRCTDRGEIWQGGGDLWSPPRAKFQPHRCNVSPLWGENPQNRPLSKLNNRRFAMRAICRLKCSINLGNFSVDTRNCEFSMWQMSCPPVRLLSRLPYIFLADTITARPSLLA